MNITLSAPRSTAAAALVAAASLALAGCAANADNAADAGSSSSAQTASDQAHAVEVQDGWTKATDADMSGSFGTLTNTSDSEAVLVKAQSDEAGMVQLHEMAGTSGSTSMQEKEDGISIPAGESAELAPGGDHIMLMKLKNELKAGDPVDITLTYADGSTAVVPFTTKDYSGADESYSEQK
ncbi:copper chaperone PCu(A)C [Arthrobacter rhombi]|uniref:Copper metallochaperone, bacterial analog of Cox17 protein n=1 Tax=Arthrobacter rhombi TaxID=71253 RepID=A0A1R4GWT2_9MICC|nr:copper chaperone PCu(A)C [Arthrobacter rhombi]SJM72601.1 Copper metallochaperone, bacterial analog of Cox17 protein [Arthrobacter rhombi]